MKHRLTASKIALGRLCLWWARADVEVPASVAGEAADLGTAVHGAAEDEASVDDLGRELEDEGILEAFRAATLGVVDPRVPPAKRETFSLLVKVWRAWWDEESPTFPEHRQEAAYALDPASATARPFEAANRDYSAAGEHEVPGTLDLVAWGQARADVLVVDYKTGRGPHRVVDHEDQLLFGGAAAWLTQAEPRKPVCVAVLHITPDGAIASWRHVEELELRIFLEELRRLLLEELPTAEPRPGLHCEELYCPARAVCPATRTALLAAEVPLDARRRLPLVGPVETPAAAFAILVAAPLLEAWIEDRVRAARAFADAHVLAAPDGRVYRGWPTKRETPRLDVAGALEALRGAIGDEAAAGAVKTKVSTSFDAIKKSIRERGLKPVRDLEERAREALRAVGALKVSEFPKYEFRKAES